MLYIMLDARFVTPPPFIVSDLVSGLSPPAVTKQDACSFYLLVRHVVKFKSAALLAVGNNHPTGFQLKPQAVAAASSLRNARVGTQRFSPKKVILSSMNTKEERTEPGSQLSSNEEACFVVLLFGLWR